MGSVVGVLRADDGNDRAAMRMVAAAPHRGGQTACQIIGRCALAISYVKDRQDAWLAVKPGIVVAFTGTLDNARALAERLGVPAATTPESPIPAAVVAAAFRAFGEETPVHLRGAFAAVLTDGSRLWCFRDHLGHRSLFYRHDGRQLFVASEAKQVVAGAEIPKEPDLAGVERIFYGAIDEPTSLGLRGVSRLAQGTMLTGRVEAMQLRRYWDPARLLESARFSEEERQGRFDALMRQAVSRTLTGEDAVSLSGGIDSCAVAAFAAPEHQAVEGRPLGAVTAVYPQFRSVDEHEFAEQVARHLRIPLYTYEPIARPLDGLLEWVRLLDGPVPLTITSMAQNYEHLCRSRELGFRSLLTGHLAEATSHMTSYLIPHLLVHGRLAALGRQLRAQRSAGRSLGWVGRQLASAIVPRPMAAVYMRTRPSYRGAGVPLWLDARRVKQEAAQSIVPARDRWRQEQVEVFTRPDLTIEAYETVQAVSGVTLRMPWADLDLCQFFLSLPAQEKFPDAQRKSLIRRLLRGKVPDAILDRRDKTVFDDVAGGGVDYPALRRWLADPPQHLGGVNYRILSERLNREDLEVEDLKWAYGLAGAHAFLSQW
jgi:asparagine synthase (glutamine-hydrolysing)